MSDLFEGEFKGKAVDVEFGANPKNGKPCIRLKMEITDGQRAGTRLPYEGKLDERNIRYTKSSMVALGWQGKDVRTFVDDVTKAAKVVSFSARIATWDPQDGRPVRQWTSVGSIGFAAAPLSKLESDKVADVNQWFAEVPDDSGGQGNGAPADDSIPF
jgi:hypothetical protein